MSSVETAPLQNSSTALDLVLRLHARREEAPGIASFELIDPAGHPLPPFEAGSHLLVECAPGVVRSYSLCNAPDERQRYRIAVLREADSRGGSAAVHDGWTVGRTVRVSRPRNHFALHAESLRPDGGRVLLLAGGIGITPLLAMAARLHACGRRFELHYCTRSAQRAAFVDALRSAPFAASVQLHHDDGPADQAFRADTVIGSPASGDHLYACGPAGFLSHVASTAERLGWPDAQRHQEVFKAEAAVAVAGDGPFEIEVANRGIVVVVQSDETALEALHRIGIEIMSSCEQGVCGTCLTAVVDGRPDHRDQYLTAADRARNDCFTPCCSRSLGGRLVVEV